MWSILKLLAAAIAFVIVAVGCVSREEQAEIDQTRAEVTEIFENLPVPPGFTQSEIQVRDPDLGQFTGQSGSVSTSWQAPDLGTPEEVLELIHTHMTNNGYQLARRGTRLRCDEERFSVSYVTDVLAIDMSYGLGNSGVSARTGWTGGFISSGQDSAYTAVSRMPDCTQ